MRLYFNLDSGTFESSPGARDAVSTLALKRGDTVNIDVSFTTGGAVTELTSGATGRFAIHSSGNYDSGLLVYAESWTKVGTGAATYYRFTPNLNTTELNALLGVGAGADVASVSTIGEIEWVIGSARTSSPTLTVTIYNDLIRDGEPSANSVDEDVIPWISGSYYDRCPIVLPGSGQGTNDATTRTGDLNGATDLVVILYGANAGVDFGGSVTLSGTDDLAYLTFLTAGFAYTDAGLVIGKATSTSPDPSGSVTKLGDLINGRDAWTSDGNTPAPLTGAWVELSWNNTAWQIDVYYDNAAIGSWVGTDAAHPTQCLNWTPNAEGTTGAPTFPAAAAGDAIADLIAALPDRSATTPGTVTDDSHLLGQADWDTLDAINWLPSGAPSA